MERVFSKEFTRCVRLTERVYIQGEDQRIERTLTDQDGRVICCEDYPALSCGGKLGAIARKITELSCIEEVKKEEFEVFRREVQRDGQPALTGCFLIRLEVW